MFSQNSDCILVVFSMSSARSQPNSDKTQQVRFMRDLNMYLRTWLIHHGHGGKDTDQVAQMRRLIKKVFAIDACDCARSQLHHAHGKGNQAARMLSLCYRNTPA